MLDLTNNSSSHRLAIKKNEWQTNFPVIDKDIIMAYQNLDNILLLASLWPVYHETEAVQTVVGTRCGC